MGPCDRYARPGRRTLGVALAVALIGCGDDAPRTDAAEPLPDERDADAAQNGVPLPADARALQEALRDYAACLRRTAPRVERSWLRYQAGIDPESGKARRGTTAEPFIHRLERDLTPCRSLSTEGSPVSPEMTAAVVAYVDAVSAYAALTERLAPYYDEQTYKDDGWALGTELAPALAAAHGRFTETAAQLGPRLARDRDEADRAALRLLEERDAPAVYGHAIRVRLDARAVARCLDVEAPSATQCRDAVTALTQSRTAVESDLAAPDAGDRDDEPRARFVFWLRALARTCKRLEAAATAAIDALAPGGSRRPRFGDAQRDAVRDTARHVEDVADNVRLVL